MTFKTALLQNEQYIIIYIYMHVTQESMAAVPKLYMQVASAFKKSLPTGEAFDLGMEDEMLDSRASRRKWGIGRDGTLRDGTMVNLIEEACSRKARYNAFAVASMKSVSNMENLATGQGVLVYYNPAVRQSSSDLPWFVVFSDIEHENGVSIELACRTQGAARTGILAQVIGCTEALVQQLQHEICLYISPNCGADDAQGPLMQLYAELGFELHTPRTKKFQPVLAKRIKM